MLNYDNNVTFKVSLQELDVAQIAAAKRPGINNKIRNIAQEIKD